MIRNIRNSAARPMGVLAAALFSLTSATAEASRVAPMIVDLKATGRDSVGRVELTNDAGRDLAYEVQMMRGDISPDGQLALDPADEQFIVFPPQAIVEANSQQVFRIQYVGEEALDRSQVYYLSVKQIPVAFDEGQNQVQVVINYNVLVNVVPDGTEPMATVRSASYVEREQSVEGLSEEDIPEIIPLETGLVVDVGNDGTRYFFAGQSDWSIRAETLDGKTFELSYTGEEMSQLIGAGVVGPGKNRIFFIPTEVAIDTGTLNISIDP